MDYLKLSWKNLVALAVLATAALALPQFLATFDIFLVTMVLILALFSLSFNLLLGYGGMISFGHAAYYALGAYGAGILFKKLGVPMPLAFAAAPFIAALGAAVLGYFCVRRAHAYFIMLTLAFAQIIFAVIHKWYSLTGGDNGLLGVRPSPSLMSPQNYYYFTLGVVAVCIYLMYRLINSPFGLAVKAIRENPVRATAVGINVWLHRWILFTIAGFFGGVAGALNVFFTRSAFPEFAFWHKSGEAMMATIVGGAGHFFGPVLGSAIYLLLNRLVVRYTEHWLLVVGGLLVIVVLGFPRGLIGIDWKGIRWRRRRAPWVTTT